MDLFFIVHLQTELPLVTELPPSTLERFANLIDPDWISQAAHHRQSLDPPTYTNKLASFYCRPVGIDITRGG